MAANQRPTTTGIAPHEEFHGLMKALSKAADIKSKITVFTKIGSFLNTNESHKLTKELKDAVESSNIIHEFVNVLKHNKHWVSDTPFWASNVVSVYSLFRCNIPIQQTQELIDFLLPILKSNPTGEGFYYLFRRIFYVESNKLHYLDYAPLYDLVKFIVHDNKMHFGLLIALTDDCTEWQYKLIQDKALILQLCKREDNEDRFRLVLFNIAQHPDAKALLPPHMLSMVRDCNHAMCKDICALLCNEAELDSLKVGNDYIETKKRDIQVLLNSKTKLEAGGGGFNLNLLELVLPLVNLSVMDPNKEIIGKHLIIPLLAIMEIKQVPFLISYIADYLQRSQRETAKILWNLSFLDSNRKLIERNNGVQILQRIRKETDDEVLKTNTSGILYMFSKNTVVPELSTSATNEGHIMISYNWSHQPTVQRLAKSLKERGFKVWLDIEQMKGSTLESMASAIEGASLVLVCVSQKYKDSPNCRLEGEYCINRRVAFVPLMMQCDYKPDGWLGILLGSKLYHNFWDEENWDQKLAGLLQEMTSIVPVVPSPTSAQPHSKGIQAWSTEDVSNWLKQEQLGEYCELFVHKQINGKRLLELKAIHSSQNVLPYVEKIGVTDITAILDLTSALRKL